MKLTFRQPHMSITAFPEVDVPSFTIITGLNGAGKTHLLNALRTGAIGNDVTGSTPENVQLFDWTTLVPKDSEQYESHMWATERMQQATTYDLLINGDSSLANRFGLGVHQMPGAIVLAAARRVGLTAGDPKAVARMTEGELTTALGGDVERAKTAKTAIAEAVDSASDMIRKAMLTTSVETIAAQVGKPIFLLDREEILSGATPSWGQTTLFQQSFAKLFVAYRDLWLENQNKQRAKETGDTEVLALTNEDFIKRHGKPPWEVVNALFEVAGLGFKIDKPYLFSNLGYTPRLTKTTSGARMTFGQLSSGEKILMSFALCLYYAQDGRQTTTYPKILLFDEVDAPLHPSMARRMIDVIQKVLVEQHRLYVIATTHSASTVAMAPDDSLFVIESGTSGLKKTTKAQALNILTVGVPTVAISFGGRRQVLTESEADAEIYGRIYDILRPSLGLERSLEFLGTGVKGASGADRNTGCDTVKKLVGGLVDAGNASVFGLIDSDKGKNKAEGRIAILANGKRDGIENAVLDPLLIAVLIARDLEQHRDTLGIPKDVSFREFLNWPAEKLQPIVEAVERAVLGDAKDAVRQPCKYHGGLLLSLRTDYLEMDDHKLEGQLLAALPGLNEFTRGKAGTLMRKVVEKAMEEEPGLVPTHLVDTLKALLEAESHIETPA